MPYRIELTKLAIRIIIGGDGVDDILHARRRLTRQMDEDANAVFGVGAKGRYLVVFIVESTFEDNDWDIIAARGMAPDEIAMFEQYAGGQR